MEMRKYLVTVHKDGRITAVEYEEPQGFVYGSTDDYNHAMSGAYNLALRDVKTILEAEKTRCQDNSKLDKYGQDWQVFWSGRSIECVVVETAIDKLFRKS